jgi:hypothetical protein
MSTVRVRLLRSIILNREHAEEGSVHEVPRSLAQDLIGVGSAERHLEEGEEPEVATAVNRIEHATHGDPVTKRISGPAPKAKK